MNLITDRPKFYFKWLKSNGYATQVNFHYKDYLPNGNQPGKWLPRIKGPLQECRRGYHLMKPSNITSWGRQNYRLFLVEVRGGVYNSSLKVVCRQFRLLREIDVPPPSSGNGYVAYHSCDRPNIVKALAKAGIKLFGLPIDLQSTYNRNRKR